MKHRLIYDQDGVERSTIEIARLIRALYSIGYFISDGRRTWIEAPS